MKLRKILASGLIALMGTTSLASALDISEVDVSADLTTIENPQAAEFWNTLEADLESAILVLVADEIVDEGARVVVNIESFSINDAADTTFSMENAALIGRIHVINLENNAEFNSFELSVSIEGMTVTDESGTPVIVAQMEPEMVYETLVSSFAENVVERLE